MQLPKTRKGHDAILVVVDRLSKMVHIIPTTTSASGEVTAQLFFDHVIKLHGAPDEIICDRDPRFSGKFMTALVEIVQIHWRMSTAYHPQTDGQTERSNRILEDMLRMYVSPAQDDLDDFLSAIEFAINDSWQESIRTTPFMLNFGQHPRLGMRISNESYYVPEAKKMQAAVLDAKECLRRAQDCQRTYANQKRRELQYKVGEKVLLSTKNIRFRYKGTKKLLPKFIGPFTVVKKIGKPSQEVAY